MKFEAQVKDLNTNKADAMDNLENVTLTATRGQVMDLSKISPTALANQSASESWDASAPWMTYAMYGLGAWLLWKYVLKK